MLLFKLAGAKCGETVCGDEYDGVGVRVMVDNVLVELGNEIGRKLTSEVGSGDAT